MTINFQGQRLPRRMTWNKCNFVRVGSFTSKQEAEDYLKRTPHSVLVRADIPKQFGYGVIWHVYREEVWG